MINHVARIGPMAKRNKTPRRTPESSQFAWRKTSMADKRAGVIVPPCPAPKNPGANATARTPDRQKMRWRLSSMRRVSIQPTHSMTTTRITYPMVMGYWMPIDGLPSWGGGRPMALASVLGKRNDAVPVAHLYAVGEMLFTLEVIPQPPRATLLVAKWGNIDDG